VPVRRIPRGCASLRERPRPIRPIRLPLLAAIVVLLIILGATLASIADAKTWQRPMRGHSFVERHYPGCQTWRCVARVRAKIRARAIRRVTPYRCSFGRYAIPCSVVRCESTDGSWDTINSIGAKGPYQFLNKDSLIPWPVKTSAHRLAHHRLAAKLWAESHGHWAQCL
jgi:hypothetical protein